MSARKHIFDINGGVTMISVKKTSNFTGALALELGYDPSPVDVEQGTLYAGCILIFLNILIISEVGLKTNIVVPNQLIMLLIRWFIAVLPLCWPHFFQWARWPH